METLQPLRGTCATAWSPPMRKNLFMFTCNFSLCSWPLLLALGYDGKSLALFFSSPTSSQVWARIDQIPLSLPFSRLNNPISPSLSSYKRCSRPQSPSRPPLDPLQQIRDVCLTTAFRFPTSDRTNIAKRVKWVLPLKCKTSRHTGHWAAGLLQQWVRSTATRPLKLFFDHIHTLSYSCTTLNQLLCMKELSLYLQRQLPKILRVPGLILALSKPQNILISESLWLLFKNCSWWCPIDSVLC